MSSELKIARSYHKAINKDFRDLMYNNSPRAIEVRNDIIPRALAWINKRLWNYYLYVDNNHCFIKKLNLKI